MPIDRAKCWQKFLLIFIPRITLTDLTKCSKRRFSLWSQFESSNSKFHSEDQPHFDSWEFLSSSNQNQLEGCKAANDVTSWDAFLDEARAKFSKKLWNTIEIHKLPTHPSQQYLDNTQSWEDVGVRIEPEWEARTDLFRSPYQTPELARQFSILEGWNQISLGIDQMFP